MQMIMWRRGGDQGDRLLRNHTESSLLPKGHQDWILPLRMVGITLTLELLLQSHPSLCSELLDLAKVGPSPQALFQASLGAA